MTRLPGLRALFLAELVSEECEISWLKLGDVTPLLTAWPDLESFQVRGGDGLELQPARRRCWAVNPEPPAPARPAPPLPH